MGSEAKRGDGHCCAYVGGTLKGLRELSCVYLVWVGGILYLSVGGN